MKKLITRFKENCCTFSMLSIALLIVTASLSLVHVVEVNAQQGNTQINTTLQSATDPPQINNTSPASGTVTNNPTIPLTGNTVNATSLDVYINGVLVTTLDVSGGSYNYNLLLVQGNNTIRLVARSSVSGLSSEQTIIVTYQPNSTPSDPNNPPDTNLPGQNPPGPTGGSNRARVNRARPPRTPNTGIFERLRNNLSFNHDSGYVKPLGHWLALALAITFGLFALGPTNWRAKILAWLKLGKKTDPTIRLLAAALALFFALLSLL